MTDCFHSKTSRPNLCYEETKSSFILIELSVWIAYFDVLVVNIVFICHMLNQVIDKLAYVTFNGWVVIANELVGICGLI
jgi:hypothetical protein